MEATSSNSTSTLQEYEVFLSFRGPDTRNSFTDFLHADLEGNGVVVFRDSEDLRYGGKIAELLQALSNSRIFVAVLSKTFASSVWCLREIEHAVNLRNSKGAPEILPIFLDVTPDDVKLRTELYAKALNEHEEKYRDEVGRWKAALEIVGKIRGWEGQGQRQAKLVKSVVGEILTMVKKKEKFVTDLIGIEERVNDVMELLNIDSENVRFIGIHGMGGIGKTTLVKIIFNKVCSQFDKCSFLSDVREKSMNENGLVDLQKKLARDLHNSNHIDNIMDIDDGRRVIQDRARLKKALIVLDDVDKAEQLNNLVGAPISFSSRSTVLVTTRDKGILTSIHGILTYEVNHLDSYQALKLFSMHAFKCHSPPAAYSSLSEQVVSKTGGLPLTLNVIGSHLYKKSEEIWIETLDELSKTLPNKVMDKLAISYNTLRENQKCIFLDIACFMIEWQKTMAINVWEACNLYPRTALEVLTNKSLIKIDDYDYIWMHDQLREFGRHIVLQESSNDVAGPRRLGDSEKAIHIVRMKKRGDKKIEALMLDFWSHKPNFIEEMENLPNLKFLKLRMGPFQVGNKIKVVILERCTRLTRTLDFSECLYLERLPLLNCSRIQVIDSSGKFKSMISINIDNCPNLQSLPLEIGALTKLKYFSIVSNRNCKFYRFGSFIGSTKGLKAYSS